MGFALSGVAFGVVGPLYGDALYHWAGKELPFLILALVPVIEGGEWNGKHALHAASSILRFIAVPQLVVIQPRISREPLEGSSFKELIQDPYIMVATGNSSSKTSWIIK